MNLRISLILLLTGMACLFQLPMATPATAQLGVLTTYEAEGSSPAKNENYQKARNIAVARALRTAVNQALEELLGEQSGKGRDATVRKILRRPKKFVKSYRYLESVDDTYEHLSRVKLEVVLFTDALNKALNNAGLVSSSMKEKSVVVLIKERSFTNRAGAKFWDYIPMSEVALSQNLVAAGITVIGRDKIFGTVSEDRVVSAARGDVTSAVDIGLKAGAEIVIVGTASSSQLGNAGGPGPVSVQGNLSVKAVSAIKSKIIAAKSDFTTARAVDPMTGELQAFEVVGKKMARFLTDAIHRYWAPDPESIPVPELVDSESGEDNGPEEEGQEDAPEDKPSPPSKPAAASPPGIMEDL